MQKKEQGQYLAILTEQGWSTKHLLYGQNITPKNFAFAENKASRTIMLHIGQVCFAFLWTQMNHTSLVNNAYF